MFQTSFFFHARHTTHSRLRMNAVIFLVFWSACALAQSVNTTTPVPSTSPPPTTTPFNCTAVATCLSCNSRPTCVFCQRMAMPNATAPPPFCISMEMATNNSELTPLMCPTKYVRACWRERSCRASRECVSCFCPARHRPDQHHNQRPHQPQCQHQCQRR